MKSKTRIAAATVATAIALLGVGALQPLAGIGERRGTSSRLVATRLAERAHRLLQQARSDADPRVLPEARRLLRRSLEVRPEGNFEASVGMAAVSNASHDFSASVRWSRRAIAINPYAAAPYGLLGDALFELGHGRAADAAYQDMIDRRPDVASYVRASYSAQSHGNWDAAIITMKAAIDAAPPAGEEAAWLRHQLGDIYATLGRYERSERENRIGTKLAPGYVPPTVGIAESLIARGRYRAALPIMKAAARDLPAVEYLVTLGDLYWATGRRTAATDTYDRAARRLGVYRASRVLPDHDFILLYADHGYRRAATVSEARSVYSNRPTPAAADSLAWALHGAGKDRQAYRYARLALRTETQPDGSQHFHAAAIAAGLGNTQEAARLAARALEIDPRFSLFHLAEARQLAEG